MTAPRTDPYVQNYRTAKTGTGSVCGACTRFRRAAPTLDEDD